MSMLLSRITIDPNICHGKPVVHGLRYPVESLLEYLAGGGSIEDLVEEFLDLSRDGALACIGFVAKSINLRQLSGELRETQMRLFMPFSHLIEINRASKSMAKKNTMSPATSSATWALLRRVIASIAASFASNAGEDSR